MRFLQVSQANILSWAPTKAYLLISVLLFALSPVVLATQKADAVLVDKTNRTLRLLNDGVTLREFPISLGKQPVGHKQYEGDQRTPEGRYTLDWRNENSKFYRSIHISYPNARDVSNARRKGKSAGGNIMIHGLPNLFGYAPWLYVGRDWTDGCIAVTDIQMDEIWELVDDGTPIVILP